MKNVLLILLLVFIWSCTDASKNSSPQIDENLDENLILNDDTISQESTLAFGNSLPLSVTINDPQAVVEWSATSGAFDTTDAANVNWTPPASDLATRYTIAVKVSLDNGKYDTASVEILVYNAKGPLALNELFTDGSWNVPNYTAELCGITYDSSSDAMFMIKCSLDNEVIRYSFTNQTLETLYSYSSQWDYGARIISGDLFITRSYDNSILRLTNLTDHLLSRVDQYQFAGLAEVMDVAIQGTSLYVVMGNFFTSNQHNGIQYLLGPNYTSLSELLSATDSGWADPQYVSTRSIISFTDNGNSRFAINNGDAVELRDGSGALLVSKSGYALSYLQKDSQNRIYTLTGYSTNTTITRWSPDMSTMETFTFDSSPYNGGNGLRFILRELTNSIEVVYAGFRDRDPRFGSTTIAK